MAFAVRKSAVSQPKRSLEVMKNSSDPRDITDTDRETAREYVLGVLDGDALRSFERKLSGNVLLQGQVAQWQEHFTSLGMNIDEISPNATVLGHLKRELWSENRLPWNRRIRIWEYALGGIAAAMIAFAVFRFGDAQVPVAPVMRAEIVIAEQGLTFHMGLRTDTGLLQIERLGGLPDAENTYVLWGFDDADTLFVIGRFAQQPVSVLRVQDRVVGALIDGKNVFIPKELRAVERYEKPSEPIFGTAQFLGAVTQ